MLVLWGLCIRRFSNRLLEAPEIASQAPPRGHHDQIGQQTRHSCVTVGLGGCFGKDDLKLNCGVPVCLQIEWSSQNSLTIGRFRNFSRLNARPWDCHCFVVWQSSRLGPQDGCSWRSEIVQNASCWSQVTHGSERHRRDSIFG